MKRLVIGALLSLLAIAAFGEWNYDPEIISRGDEFTGSQFVAARVPIHDVRHYRVDFAWLKDEENTYSFVVADLRMYNWAFIETCYMLIDGERLELPLVDYERNTLGDGRVSETVYFDAGSPDLYERIADAETARISFRGSRGRVDTEIESDGKETIGRFIAELPRSSD